MRLSLICFSAIVLVAHGTAATVTGTVQVTGSSKHSLTDLVVWLRPVSSPPPETVDLPHRTLLQKDKMFRPHVLPVRVGTVVDFPNADPIFHNAFSNYDGQIFDVSLYPPGTTRSVRFRRPGIVRVFCNIHPMMSAIILVLDTPYFAKLDAAGRYRIENVAAGEYELNLFDERATGNPAPKLRMTVAESDTEAPSLRVSEAGYVPVPHHNKYGQDYPAEASSDNYGGGVPK